MARTTNPEAVAAEWLRYERANKRARADYMIRQGQMKLIRERDQRGRKRRSKQQNRAAVDQK